MTSAASQSVAVTFPAAGGFDRIGRVTIGGLALRAGVGVAETERLRDAVDLAVTALGPDGRVRLVVAWDSRDIDVSLTNADAAIPDTAALERALSAHVAEPVVTATSVRFAAP